MYLKRIRELREDNDYKQSFISKYLGIKQNSYSQIENGLADLKIDYLVKLCELYNCSSDYILELSNTFKHTRSDTKYKP